MTIIDPIYSASCQRFTLPYKSKSWFNRNIIFFVIDKKSSFKQCSIICLLCSRLSHIQLRPWGSLKYLYKYLGAQCNCATVSLYALCCNNWYRNNCLSYHCVRTRKNSHACIDCYRTCAATCKRVPYCKNRDPSCYTSVLCGNVELFCQQLHVALRLKGSILQQYCRHLDNCSTNIVLVVEKCALFPSV